MQKLWFGSRRRTKVRQRAKTRLKTTHKIEIRKNFYQKCRFTIDILDNKTAFFIILISCDFVLR